MLQIIVSVTSLQNGSRKEVSGTGKTSMSDSLMACQPRMDEPSKPRPSSKTPSSRASAGMVKCCHKPGKSMKRRSTARTSFSRIRARTSLGVTNGNLQGGPRWFASAEREREARLKRYHGRKKGRVKWKATFPKRRSTRVRQVFCRKRTGLRPAFADNRGRKDHAKRRAA